LKNVPKKINVKTIFILVSVASLSFLSPILSNDLKQGTGLLINNANALPPGTGYDALDFPEIPRSILDKILNREEVSEPSGESTSPSLPFPDNDELDRDESLVSSDLSTPSAKIIRGIGDEIPNQYIVVLKNRLPSAPAIEALEARNIGAEVRYVYDSVLSGFTINVPNERVLEAIQRNPNVAYIEQDMQVQASPQILPRGVNRVDGELSSTISGNGAGSVNGDIAILDSGIQLSHPDLNVYKQKTFVSGTSSANDDNGHGTHVAGIAAAKDNSIGAVGFAPGARLWAVKVLGSSGSGSISTVIKGIDYVTQNAGEVDVANLSLGCECTSTSLNTAISNSVNAGITFVVAAGNNSRNAASFSPANHPSVIAVSAIVDTDGKCGRQGVSTSYGGDDRFASFSNYGSVVDLAAPGVSIYSTYRGSTYATMSGTSMAAPHVAGAAALYDATHPGASPSSIASSLKSTGSKPSTVCDGRGHGYFYGDPDSYSEPLLYVNPY
jgi:subtilisin family serine protease